MSTRIITLVPYPEKGSDALRPKTERDHELAAHLTGHPLAYLPKFPLFLLEYDDFDWFKRLADDHGWEVLIERDGVLQIGRSHSEEVAQFNSMDDALAFMELKKREEGQK